MSLSTLTFDAETSRLRASIASMYLSMCICYLDGHGIDAEKYLSQPGQLKSCEIVKLTYFER